MTSSESAGVPPLGAPVIVAGESLLHRVVGPAAGLATGLVILALAQTIDEPAIATGLSPRWWPLVLGGIIVALSLVVGVMGLVRRSAAEEREEATRAGAVRVAAVVGTILVYGVFWYFVDFRVATVALVAAIAAIGGGRGWKALLLFPVIVTAVLYGLFGVLLRVPL